MPQLLFYLCSNAIWIFFSASLSKNANTFTANASVFGKVYFPRLTMPVSNVLSSVIRFGVQMLPVLIFQVYYLGSSSIPPVKRYSSGMYVKLAFSVTAHLDSEIMIMDEVLAVGDMAFQKKCLDKMRDAAKKVGRTVLYVSHNMNTIRQLCDRCVVLDKGKVVFEGDVEEAIKGHPGNSMSLKSRSVL